MNFMDFSVAVLAFALAVFIAYAVAREAAEPRESPRYRGLTRREVAISKVGNCAVGIGLSFFCVLAGKFFLKEARREGL